MSLPADLIYDSSATDVAKVIEVPSGHNGVSIVRGVRIRVRDQLGATDADLDLHSACTLVGWLRSRGRRRRNARPDRVSSIDTVIQHL